jgi:CRP/FNR family transcriptional regulator
MTQTYRCLHDIPVFNGLSRECFVSFCDASKKITVSKGEYLFHQGDPADAVYIVKSGTMKMVHLTESGDEIVIRIVASKQAIAENTLFTSHPTHLVSAIALEETHLCSLQRDAYEKIVLENPKLATEIIRNLGDRLTNLHIQMAENTIQSSSDKVLLVLKQLAQQKGVETEKGILININITQSDLSSMVGLSRVMTSQILKKFESQGIISKVKRKYMLHH